MAIRNTIITGLMSLALAGSLSISVNRQYNSQELPPSQIPTVVQVGQIGYSEGDLVSYDFVRCSAVIFDYNNSAFMAHAVPLLNPEFIYEGKKSITVGNVIDSLVEESEKVGFNPTEAKVYVDAGNQESLDTMVTSLRKKKIPLFEGKLRFNEGYDPQSSDSKTIKYAPSRNEITLFNTCEFPDYRVPTNYEGP